MSIDWSEFIASWKRSPWSDEPQSVCTLERTMNPRVMPMQSHATIA